MSSKRTSTKQSIKNYLSIYTLTLVLLMVVGPSKAQLLLEEDRVIVQNETNINSTDLEYSPTFYKDGIVFITTKFESLKYKITDTRIDQNIMSIYRAGRNMDGTLRTPEPFAWELLSSYHEGPLTFDRTGEKIYFTRNDTSAKGKKKSTRKLKIYNAVEFDGQWANVQLLSFNAEDYNTAHPTISVDGDMMYFSSDREGGYGGMDLYVVLKSSDGEWGEPKNLGATINTEQNEVFPFVHADGTLYFSSNGHNSLGKLDIYYATKNGEQWEAPINLGEPFNSASDDMGIIVDRDNKNGYFSSNRAGGIGEDDIYSFHIITDQIADNKGKNARKKGKKDVIITLKDENGDPIENANINYMNLDDIVLSDDVTKNDGLLRLKTEDGQLKFDNSNKGNKSDINENGEPYVTLEDGKYILNINKDGYVPTQYAIVTDQMGDNVEITLERAVDCVAFVGSVLDEKNSRPVAGAIVTIRDMDSQQSMKLTSDEKGLFNYCLKCNKSYSVSAMKNGSVSEVGLMSTKDGNCGKNNTLSITLYLSANGLDAPLAVGTVIQLPNIYYNFDDATLRPDALVDLNLVVELLNMYPEVELELASHTDARGRSRYNEELSQRRSNNAVQYVLSQGISNNRIRAAGYGEAKVRNRCVDGVTCGEQEHQQNRRTEIVVTKVNPTLTTTRPYTQLTEERASDVTATSTPSATYTTPYTEKRARPEYLVIAGTFRNSDNAIDRASKIRNFGFSKAEVVRMDNSVYHAVVVERYYGNRSSAENLVSTLNRDYQLKSYVRMVR